MYIKNSEDFKVHLYMNDPKKKTNFRNPFAPKSTENKAMDSIAAMIEANLKEQRSTEDIAFRIALGKDVSPEDRQYLAEKSPLAAQDAAFAAEERKRLEQRLKNAKTPEEALRIISYAQTFALSTNNVENGQTLRSRLLMAVIAKAKQDYAKGRQTGDQSQEVFNSLNLKRKYINRRA